MFGGKKLWRDAAVLTLGSLLLRCAGLVFQVILAGRLEAEGVGLFQLVLSVYGLAVSLAAAGIRYVATRLVSEELGLGRTDRAVSVLRRCFIAALTLSVISGCLLTLLSDTAADRLICDARAGSCLRILAMSLPFCSMTAVMGGWFTAVGKASRSAAVQLFEQAVMMLLTLVLVPEAGMIQDTAKACELICTASVAADAAAFLFSSALYLHSRRGFGFHGGGYPAKRILALGAPIAVTAWARSALSTLKHSLIPAALRLSGADPARALAAYGVVQGMAFPALAFPSAFFYSLAEVLVPELTRAQVGGDAKRVRETVARSLRICFGIASGISALFLAYGKQLGTLLYGSAEAGAYMTALSPFVLVMYMDAVTDGMLRGLGEQFYSMCVNLADAVLSLAAVRFIVPIFAVRGYLALIFFSELFNFLLSFGRLVKKTGLTFSPGGLLFPPLCAAGAVGSSSFLLRLIGLSPAGALGLAAHILLTGAAYAGLMLAKRRAERAAA